MDFSLSAWSGRPKYKAWIPVPVLLPGEKTSTRVEPAKSLYAAIPGIVADAGVLDAAIWVGYPWADEPRNHAVVMVTGDDESAVTAGAEALAEHFGVSGDAPFAELPEEFRNALFFGTGGMKIPVRWEKDGRSQTWHKSFEGICRLVERHWHETESESVKKNMSWGEATVYIQRKKE